MALFVKKNVSSVDLFLQKHLCQILQKQFNSLLRWLELCEAGAFSGHTTLKKGLPMAASKGRLVLNTGFLAPEGKNKSGFNLDDLAFCREAYKKLSILGIYREEGLRKPAGKGTGTGLPAACGVT